MPPPRKDICDCDVLQRMADDPKFPIEFDATLNEYHITHAGDGYALIYYCPFCGGSTLRLSELTKNLRTIQDVTTALGEPDIRQPVGVVTTTPERDGKPEVTRSCPVLIYTKLSDVADIHVTVYPTDRVAITFQGKGIKKSTG